MRAIIVVLALLVASFYGGMRFAGSGAADEQAASTSEQTKRVRVDQARSGARNQLLRFPGVTRSVDRATLTFLVSGTLGKSLVEIGDKVEAGQTLATIYNPQLKPQKQAAESRLREVDTRLKQVKEDLRQVRYLFETGAATQDELDQQTSAYRSLQASKAAAQAQLAEANQVLQESQIIAPFTGTVDRVYFQAGEFVPTGQPVIELNGGDNLEVEIQIPETLVGRLQTQQVVSVRFPFFEDLELKAPIVELGQGVSRLGQLFPVVVALPQTPGLRAGLTAELVFDVTAQEGLQVPVQSVIDPGSGNERLFKVVDNHAIQVPVEVVSLAGASVVVQGDLLAGDSVVIAGQRALVDGEPVEVLK